MKQKSAKLAFVASILSLVLCFTMLVGTTFAWFTDSATSQNNVIKSGTLDVELYYQRVGESSWSKVTESTNIFSENGSWEPGYAEVIKLKIVNAGNLALKYRLGVNVVDETGSVNVSGENFKLSDYIRYGIVDGANDYTRAEAISAVNSISAPLSSPYTSDMVTLLPKSDENSDFEDYITLVFYMPGNVGNEINFAIGEVIPNLYLGINLLAIQETAESDSFDASYDEGLDPSIDYNE
jgi:predicted ribosomally synthesized peptide with SipW-like signal peptide